MSYKEYNPKFYKGRTYGKLHGVKLPAYGTRSCCLLLNLEPFSSATVDVIFCVRLHI